MSPRRPPRQARLRWRAQKTAREHRLRTATELAGVLVTNGNCALAGSGWDTAEIGHATATSNRAAATAAAPALKLCAACPVIEECRQWATVDRYTGLAAGSSWVRGAEYDADTTRNNSRTKALLAS